MDFLRLVTVEPVRFLFTMALSMQHIATKALVVRKVCLLHQNDTAMCVGNGTGLYGLTPDSDTVRENAVAWCLYLDVSTGFLGALVSFVYGPASDKFGRRGLLVLYPLGMIFGSVSFLVQSVFIHLPLHYLFVSSALMGLGGYYSASYIATMSYMSDITDQSERSLRLGIMESFSLIGGSIGLLLAWLLLYARHQALLYVIIILSQLVAIALVRFWIPESADVTFFQEEEMQRPGTSASHGFCVEVYYCVKRASTVYVKWRTLNRRQLLLINQTVGILSSFGSSAELDLTILDTSIPPLSWTGSNLLAFLATKDAVKGVVLSVGIPLLYVQTCHWTVRTDMVITMNGLLSISASLVLMSFAYTTLLMMLVPVVGCLGGFPATLLASVKSKLVEPHEYGAVFACASLIHTVCHVVGRLLFHLLYKATLTTWPRPPFLGMGVFYVLLLTMITYMWCLSGHLGRKPKDEAKVGLMTSYDVIDDDEEITLFAASKSK